MTAAKRVRTPEYLAWLREHNREQRRKRREAQGFQSAAEFREFAKAQARKLQAARKAAGAVVITPSIAKLQAERVAPSVPAETVDEFLARGGRVDVLPGFTGVRAGPLPVRHYATSGGAW